MKKIILLCLLVSSFALAADSEKITDSSKALVGALNGLFENQTGVVAHLPGYGLQISTRTLYGEVEYDEAVARISEVLKALSSTIQGLDPDDWISVYFRGENGDRLGYELVLRMKPGQPDSFEEWLFSEKQ